MRSVPLSSQEIDSGAHEISVMIDYNSKVVAYFGEALVEFVHGFEIWQN